MNIAAIMSFDLLTYLLYNILNGKMVRKCTYQQEIESFVEFSDLVFSPQAFRNTHCVYSIHIENTYACVGFPKDLYIHVYVS